MSTAGSADTAGAPVLHVVHAPPFLTVQDLGRPGFRHLGIPPGGAMDAWALQAANVLAGNAPHAPALEWALGPGTLRLARDATLALAGASCDATLGGAPVEAYCTLHARAGDELAIGAPRGGRFAYVAIAGGIAVPPVLGSAATYLPAAFGGLLGRRLQDGDALPLGDVAPRAALVCPPALRRDLGDDTSDHAGDDARGPATIRIVRGPQADALDADGWRTLRDAAWTVSATADRTGYRLDGPRVAPIADTAARPSEPGCAGALQLPPNGQPIVLMADAPTVGGYPKPAVVCSADLGRLAQRTPGAPLRLVEVTLEQAQRAYRRRRVALWTLERLR